MTTSKFVTLATLSVIFIFLTITTQAQVYLLNSETNGTTINACSGTLYDSGGEMGSYQSNENYTITICSVDPNSPIKLQFNVFTIENPFDFLFVYDGPSTSSPFISENSGSTLSGQSIISSGNCLTIKFTSDGSANYNGFAAEISCLQACQNYTIDISSTNPPVIEPEVANLNICLGSSIVFSAEADFPENNTNYFQSIENLIWNWNISKIGGVTEQISEAGLSQLEYTFNDPGVYFVFVSTTDESGCTALSSTYRVITSLRPNFEAILIDTGICLGETIELTNEISIDTLNIIVENGIFDTICLSDEYYQLWQSMCQNLIQTNSNIEITSADEIESICINMEHSYIGDLSILLTCPNGQSVSLFEYPNGGGPAYFGIPIDDDTQPCVAGVGFDYCWSMDATANIVDFAQLQETIPAGSYIPVESFDNLVGCPVSGDWCVSFQDNLYADDGIVFSISINFAEGFYSYDTITTIINTVDLSPDSEDIFWTGPGVGTNSGSTSVIPEIPGEYTYTLSVTNNLGCTIDTSFNVTVYEINDPFCGTFCNSIVYENSTDTINDGSYEYPSQNNTSCDWLISLPSKTAEDLFFYWNYFDVYEGDILSIYAGNSDASPLVLELSGNDEVPDWFIVPGNEAFISYKTNEFLRSPGWEMVYQTVLTGLNTNNNSGIVIFPNPADNYITVYGLDSASELNIIDICGRVIYSNPVFTDGIIDISNFASGIYFVKIQKESHNETFKIIKK